MSQVYVKLFLLCKLFLLFCWMLNTIKDDWMSYEGKVFVSEVYTVPIFSK